MHATFACSFLWQTEEDTKAGGSPQVLISRVVGRRRTERGRWSAEIELVDGSFKSGSVSA
jgi:hypothetical protein